MSFLFASPPSCLSWSVWKSPAASMIAPKGSEAPLSRAKYYVPGSVLRVRVDTSSPLAYGMDDEVDVFFNRSPVFRLRPDPALKGVRPVAWFDRDKPLRSGWAWGQHYLKDGIAVIDARVGRGSLFLFGPEVTFRAQPHGTFKFLFNAIYLGPSRRPRAF